MILLKLPLNIILKRSTSKSDKNGSPAGNRPYLCYHNHLAKFTVTALHCTALHRLGCWLVSLPEWVARMGLGEMRDWLWQGVTNTELEDLLQVP